MSNLEELLKGEIVEVDYKTLIVLISHINRLNINTLCAQQSINGTYFCKIDEPAL